MSYLSPRSALCSLGFLLVVGPFSELGAQSPSPTPTPTPAATPLPPAGIVGASEADHATLTEIETSIPTHSSAKVFAERLDRLSTEATKRAGEDTALLTTLPSVSALTASEARWQTLRVESSDLKRQIQDALTQLSTASSRLAALQIRWETTRKANQALPPEISARLTSMLTQIAADQKRFGELEVQLLALQNQAAVIDGTITSDINRLATARTAAINRLTYRDSPPLWSARSFTPGTASQLAPAPFVNLTAVGSYVGNEAASFVIHSLIWIGLIAFFRWARTKARFWVATNPELESSTKAFETPIASATVLAFSLTSVLHPNAPRELTLINGALLIFPLLWVMRRLVEPQLVSLSWGMAAFYLLGQIRQATGDLPGWPRLILLAESLSAAAFSLWVLRSSRDLTPSDRKPFSFGPFLRLAVKFAGGALFFAGMANLFGYANLGLFLTQIILESAFVGVLLYAGVRIADGLITFFLNIPPLALLTMVQRHRGLFERRFYRIFRVAAAILWILFFLDQLSLRKPLFNQLDLLLNSQLHLGPVTAGGILEFGFTIWAAFMVSRLIRFLLEEEVYQRVQLSPGMPFAISTIFHYAILFVGFYLAAAILVGDMTKLTILAGAFSVGIGFGLQNVINNFVSGIIVLFERPIKLGDLIQMGADVGTVRRIGIRATVIQTTSGSEIIIPNGKLISDPVTNWTLSNRQRVITVAINTPNTTDPAGVMEALVRAANSIPKVSANPPPRAELIQVGGGNYSFEINAFTKAVEEWEETRSQLTLAVNTELQRSGIPIS